MSQAASQGLPTNTNDTSTASTINQAPTASLDLSQIYAPVASELRSVEQILRTELKSKTPFVDQLLEHSWLLGGKRIRPVFLLLSAAATGEVTQPHLQLAAALEMIHTATLVHDDILDDAKTRRHRETANQKWGTKVSVLLGDYLFTHSFHVASLAGSAEALRMLAQASNRVCEGEMRQNAWQGDFELSEKDYLEMITEKTAELCGVGCKMGAFMSNASPEVVDQFEGYGRNLGVAFQIIDDVLDLVGSPSDVGKTLGTDILNQKPTLPVIHSLEKLETTKRDELIALLTSETATNADVIEMLNQNSSIEYARDVAQSHAQRAAEFAEGLEPSDHSAALIALAQFVLSRTR